MLKALIVEDEINSQELLKELIAEYTEGVEVVGTAQGVKEALEKIGELSPDLLLLDIELADGDGFQVLEQVEDPNFDVIFTTAYNQYAIKAFKFSATDYLLKPVDIEELQRAVARVVEKQQEGDQEVSKERLQALISNLRNSQKGFKRIVLPTTNGFTVVDPKDIIRCESDRNYTFIFLTDGRKILVSRTIKEYEEMLVDFNFFRVHQSHLINLAFLKNYIRGRGGQVELTDGTVVDVSARKKADFMRRLQADS
ncbi:MAG: LytR/AlgR family response regulator transcription factor [Bacteroidia bacterium]